MIKLHWILFAFFISAMVALVFAPIEIDQPPADIVSDTETGASLDIIKDWRVLTGIAILTSIILVATAFMIGHGFDMPEIKMWASGEFNQVFATAIIMIIFISTLSFLDVAVADIVKDSNLGFLCDATENCGIKTANNYLKGLIDLGKSSAKEAIKDQISAAKLMGLKFGVYMVPFIFPVPLLQASYSQSYTQGYILDIDRNAIILEYSMSVLTGLTAQKFFINEIAYKVAPAVLFIGILARTFFVTRKLGGLLIAVAIGIMYVLPLAYVLNWLTLNVTLFGGNILVPNVDGECPAECGQAPPLFVNPAGQKFYSISDAYDYFGYSDPDDVDSALYADFSKLEHGTVDAMIQAGTGKRLDSCEYLANHSGNQYCPKSCRELPYPQGPECTNKDDGTGKTPEESCMELTTACKMVRLSNPADEPMRADDPTQKECPDVCKVIPPLSDNCAPCFDAPSYCRVTEKGNLTKRPKDCGTANDCEPDVNNPYNNCVYILPNQSTIESECSGCMFVPRAYTFSPAISTADDCSARCEKNPTGPPKISPSEFTKKSQEMMYGDDKIKGVAALILPAYLLLILDVTITLMFIKTFSPILGGDIDLPGLSKIT